MNQGGKPPVAAVVVTFFPDAGLPARLATMAGECDRIIVVDNGSDEETRSLIRGEGVESILLDRNLGLAKALNIGLMRAIELGFEWAITFDQDSTPRPGMVTALWQTRAGHAGRARVAVVGPRLCEERLLAEDHRWIVPHPRCRLWFARLPCGTGDLAGVAFVITSGALTDLKIYREIGPMDEGLFIDYIDHDYCLRARRAGYEILVSGAALLTHNLGAKREYRVAGRVVRPTFHSALRLRYMARNRWIVWRRYAREFPHWAAFDFVYSHYNLLRVLVFENHRFAKLVAMFRGTWDGARGRTGKIL